MRRTPMQVFFIYDECEIPQSYLTLQRDTLLFMQEVKEKVPNLSLKEPATIQIPPTLLIAVFLMKEGLEIKFVTTDQILSGIGPHSAKEILIGFDLTHLPLITYDDLRENFLFPIDRAIIQKTTPYGQLDRIFQTMKGTTVLLIIYQLYF